MKKCYSLIFASWLPLTVFAQGQTWKGSVKDNQTGQPVMYATIALYRSIDSAFVTGTLSMEKGDFQLEPIPEDTYYLEASCMGYEKLT